MQRNLKEKVHQRAYFGRQLICIGFVLAKILALSFPAHADSREPWPEALRTSLRRVAEVQWRLTGAAGELCPVRTSAIGVVIDGIDSYRPQDRDYVSRTLKMSNLPQIAAVVSGSPAERAGVVVGDSIAAIGGRDISTMKASATGQVLLADVIDAEVAALPSEKPVNLTLVRDGQTITVAIAAVARCSARIALKTEGGLDAYSDANNIAITAELVAAARNDDEIALVAGHELGHIIARDGRTRTLSAHRLIEDRADAIGFDLSYCAGYDPIKGLDLWRRVGRRDLLRWFRLPTHRSFAKRVQLLSARTPPSNCPLTRIAPHSTTSSAVAKPVSAIRGRSEVYTLFAHFLQAAKRPHMQFPSAEVLRP